MSGAGSSTQDTVTESVVLISSVGTGTVIALSEFVAYPAGIGNVTGTVIQYATAILAGSGSGAFQVNPASQGSGYI